MIAHAAHACVSGSWPPSRADCRHPERGHQMTMVLLVGEMLAHRSFNGANKSLPVLASSLHNAGYRSVQLELERPDITIDDVFREALEADLVAFAGCMTPQWPELDPHLRDLAAHLERAGKHEIPIVGRADNTRRGKSIPSAAVRGTARSATRARRTTRWRG